MALTAKSKAFAQAVVDGLSNKEAAISAGYSEKTASQQGSKLAKDSEVIAYIQKLKDGMQKLKDAPPIPADIKDAFACDDPKEKLLEFMNGADPEVSFEAAKVLMPYYYGKVAEKGKKETKEDGARSAAQSGGKFGTLNSQTTRPS